MALLLFVVNLNCVNINNISFVYLNKHKPNKSLIGKSAFFVIVASVYGQLLPVHAYAGYSGFPAMTSFKRVDY